MCGRFALPLPPQSIAEHFQLDAFPEFKPRYNIAPSQEVPSIIFDKLQSIRIIKMFHWGLIPSWAQDTSLGSRFINARSETLAEKPAFRSAFKKRRCLIPAAGFYEWKRQDNIKQPFFIRMRDEKPFAFAGLWEHWEGDEEKAIESCTILTTEPNDVMRHIHNRMPVILSAEHYDMWIDPANTNIALLKPLLRPFPSDEMEAYPVSSYVNKPQNDDPRCIEPVRL